MANSEPSVLLNDRKKSTASRYRMAAFSAGTGGGAGFVKMGNLISIPITNRNKMLAGVFCLNRPITGNGL